jgi:hypothetical protein
MELTPAQRVITFAIVVLLLVGLGVYLFLPKPGGVAAAGPPSKAPGGQPAAHRTDRAGPGTGSVSPDPTSAPSSPAGSPPPGPGKEPDIYAWLPFTEPGLGSAAQVTVKFAADYATYSYQQSTNSYLAPMKPIITGQLAELIGRAYATPGVAASRNAKKQVSVGSGVITSLRAFGSSSLTFIVALTEKITTTKGTSQQNIDYAITVTGSGANWQVSNFEFASAGNQ